MPIRYGEPNEGEGVTAILRPDGVVVMPGNHLFKNLDKWAEHVCKRWKAREVKRAGTKAA